MSTQGTPLSTFFSSFAFNRYTYDPTRDPADEFERLCVARLWGSAKREKYLAEYLSAIEETRDQQVAAFFRKYEFLQFTYSPSADPEAEFDRLRVARKWGEKKLKGIREEFQAAFGGKVEAAEWDESVTYDGNVTCDGSVILETHPNPAPGYPTVSTQGTPLSAFFSSFNFNRYTYDPAHSPADEFERLCIARQWGKEKRDRYFAEYTSAIEKIHNQSVAIFFRKYEFLQFTYSPLADPVAEFERLQAARRWGGKNLERVRKEFQAALEGNVEAVEPTGEVVRETSPDPTAGHPTMPTQESPLSAFFSSFTFNRYTYDPTQDPADEFERLCVARKWGKAKKDKYFVNYLLAIEESRYQPLAVFFQKYQFSRFSHDPLADPRAEFARLQAARKWGEKKLSTVRVEFLAALGAGSSAAQPTTRPILERPPIAEFLKERQFSGYTYGSDRPELEFKKLVEAQRRHWEKEQEANGINVRSKESKRRWKADAERTRLQDEFYEALEQQFNARLDKIAGGTGLRRDEVMVELCGAGKAPLSKKEAIEALESVHVNIYDFLELELPSTITAVDYETRNLIRLLSPGAHALNFPDDAMLGVYSYFTHRVFPCSQARTGATLALLLRVIGQYFGEFRDALGKFENEGGEELAIAVESGPDAVRELLLSRNWESLEKIRGIPSRAYGT